MGRLTHEAKPMDGCYGRKRKLVRAIHDAGVSAGRDRRIRLAMEACRDGGMGRSAAQVRHTAMPMLVNCRQGRKSVICKSSCEADMRGIATYVDQFCELDG